MKAQISLALFLTFSQIISAQNKQLDSLFNCLKYAKEDTVKARLYLEIGSFNEESNPDTALYFYNKSLALVVDRIEDKEYCLYIGRSYQALSWINCKYKSQYEKASANAQSAMNAFKEAEKSTVLTFSNKAKIGISSCYNTFGLIFWYQGIYDKAIKSYISALKILENIGRTSGISSGYTNIGIIYASQRNYNKALEYFLKATNIDEKFNSNELLKSDYSNIGMVYFYQGESEKALEFLNKSLSIALKTNDLQTTAACYSNIGNIYQEEKNYYKAIVFYNKSLNIKERIKDKYGISGIKLNISDIYLLLTDNVSNDKTKIEYYNNALKLCIQSLEMAKEINAKMIIRDSADKLKKIYLKLNDFQNAIKYADLFIEINDSLNIENNNKAIADMEAKYQNEKKQQEIELLNKDKELQNIEMKRQKMQKFAFIGGFAFMLLLAIFIFRSYRNKKKANIILNQKNIEIEQQKEEIQVQAENLAVVNNEITIEKEKVEQSNKALQSAYNKLKELEEFKESMTGMIVHDLKNPLNIILNNSDSNSETERNTIKSYANQMLNLVLNILDVQKFEKTEVSLNTNENKITDTINSAINQTSFLASQKSISLTTEISEECFGNYDNELVERILVNLLTNAIKYTPAKGNICLSAKFNNEKGIVVSVLDSGEGIPQEQLDKVFDKFAQAKAKNSGKVRSTGLGLTFCKMVVEAHKGKISVDSVQGNGTTFTFNLPDAIKTENILTENKTEEQEREFILNIENIEILKLHIERLQSLDIYKTGQIMDVINTIESGNENITQWKKEIENALFNFDEDSYKKLINFKTI